MLSTKIIMLASALLLSACEPKEPKVVPLETVMPPPAGTPAKPNELTLSPESIGPVSFGNTVNEVESRLGEQAMRLDQNDDPECSYVSFKALPKVRFMVEKGTIVRADVDKEIANVTGVNVGDSAEALKQRYPNLKEQANKYLATGKDITIPGNGKSAILMESDKGKITRVRAGLQPAVSYVEGCS